MAEVIDFNEIFYTAFEPKTQNRFIMQVDGIPSYIIKASGRPSFTSTPMLLDHINVQRKLMGKFEWEDLNITLYDPIVPSGAQAVMEWVRLAHEAVTGRNGYADFYKKDVDLFTLGPVGDKVEHWKLKGTFISTANFNEMDWSTQEPLMLDAVLSFDYAILEF